MLGCNWEPCVKIREFVTLFKASFNDWNKHNAPRLGAALAFYTVVSISPLAILVVAISSLVFNKSAAQVQLLNEVQAQVGQQGRDAIQAVLDHGRNFSSGVISTAIGLVTLLLGASGVLQELRSALNNIWEVNADSSGGIRTMIRERIFSFGMVLSVGFVLLVSLLASAALTAIAKFFGGWLPMPPQFLEVINELISLVGIGLLFACILKYVPATRVEWRDVRVGASVTAILFVAGKPLLGLYLGASSPGSSFGAAGSLVVLVVWVYYSAQIFYFGAEFTHIHAKSNRNQLEPAPSPAPQQHAA